MAESPKSHKAGDVPGLPRVAAAAVAFPPHFMAYFEVECPLTLPGQSVYVVGAAEELGAWDPAKGLRLRTSPSLFPTWRSAGLSLPAETPLEWRVVVRSHDPALPDGPVVWEPCGARLLRGPAAGLEDIRVGWGALGHSQRSAMETGPMALAALPPALARPRTGHFMANITAHCPWTRPGQSLCLVGANAGLGGWAPERGLRFTTTPELFPSWHLVAELPFGEEVECKLVIRDDDGNGHNVCWEPLPYNRILFVPKIVADTPVDVQFNWGGF